MATLAELRDLILSKLDDGTVVRPNAQQVVDQINSTIRFYSNAPFWFNQTTANLTCTTGQRILTGIPSDFKMGIEPNTLTIVQSNIRYPLVHITPLAFNTLDVNASGRPIWFTYRNGNYELYYLPSEDYPIELFYRKSYADLVNDSDTNDFTNNAPRLIEYRTLGDLLIDYREEEERGTLYLNRAMNEHEQILNETYERTATGNLSTENIVTSSGTYNSQYFY